MNPVIEWYESPEAWVEGEDIKRLGKWAFLALRDLIVKRKSELTSFEHLFQSALNNKVSLTRRQQKAMEYADEAIRLGLTETTYVAQKLGINRHSAFKLLNRAHDRMIFITYQSNIKMETFHDSTGIYSDTPPKIELDNDEIFRIQAGLKYDCPCSGLNPKCKGTANGRFGLCYPCSKTYGANKEERLMNGYEWVQAMVADIKAQAYKDAEKILFERQHMINLDISDIA